MVRPPTSIKAALLGGFLVIFTVWLASLYYLTERLTESQVQNAAIHARYAKGLELLFAVRSQVLLGSIYLRDALIGSGQSPTAAALRDQLRGLQREMNQELEEYRKIDSLAEGARWARLEDELRDYWAAALRLVTLDAGERGATAQSRLETEVIPRRDVIVGLSDEIRQVIAGAFSREQEELAMANRQAHRRIWNTTVLAVVLGVVIATLSTWYVGRLEGAIQENHAEVLRNREELKQLSGRLARAQEDERRTIARELHDEIGQALTAVDVELAVAETAVQADGRAASAVNEARTVTHRALGAVRDLSQLLRPSMLDDFGLPDTLKWYLRKFADRTGVRTEFIQEPLADRLPVDVEVCVYRAIQEALTNVSRHARAQMCRIFMQRLPSSLVVTVEDDGIGLQKDADRGGSPSGMGLVGIRERVADLGGTFRIEGRAGKGTRLTIELPLELGGGA